MFRKVKRYWYQFTHPAIGEVWQLHRVTNQISSDENHRPYEITPHRLESLIVEYKKRGYEFVSISDVAERMILPHYNKARFVAITLDDGYEDNYTNAFPIFIKYHVPFCIYVCAGYIDGEVPAGIKDNYNMLSKSQIEELSHSPLCTIGAHTRHHSRLAELAETEQMTEIAQSLDWFSGMQCTAVKDFAFPYGSYNTSTLAVLSRLGIERAVASWGGLVRRYTPEKLLEIPRVLVTEDNIK